MTDKNLPSVTPNVVVEDPRVRRVVGIALGIAALVLPITQIIDQSFDQFDLTALTEPATAIVLFLAGAFQLGVTTPNVPTYKP